MTTRFTLLIAGTTAALFACKPQVQTGSPTPAGHVVLRNAAGSMVGTLNLAPSNTGTHITGTLGGLPAGTHGIHLHAVGRCDATDFSTAGGHYNPASMHHGLENPAGPHAGDLPNINVDASGNVNVDLTDPRVTLDTSPTTGIFDADGTAIVVHAGPDDQKSDPSGNSGGRIACGVIQR
ncbi:MAG TPA: superoxide dismutase family protein [Gemmatimonadaceae bacterium]|nr:superoxide dismutase family protein [Gemmatimonadaceae bacterium]